MRRALVVFLVTAAAGLSGTLTLAYKAWRYQDTAGSRARGVVELEVPKGAGAGQVAELLSRAGLVGSPTLFRLYAGQRGAASRFRAGHYRIEAPATPRQIVDLMIRGAAEELVTVTIPEGKNLVEVAAILDAASVAPKAAIIARATDPAFVRGLELPGATMEGYLFPDTYRLRPGGDAERALVPLVRRHRQVFEELRAAHSQGVARLRKDLGFQDAQIVILASIVEKETGRAEERARIAQLFINRLAEPSFRPKLLQTDPTIIYGCAVAPLVLRKSSDACLGFDGDIKRIHLQDADNPYNTYVHAGLPPGPISNPGRASLEAVMGPDGSPYLFFVSRNDGSHHFSRTVAEHEAAVVKYQRGGRALPKATP